MQTLCGLEGVRESLSGLGNCVHLTGEPSVASSQPGFGDISPSILCSGWRLAWLLNPGLRVAKNLDFKISLS